MNKVGRNDPCSCGSGKKFKKCCIDKVKLQRTPVYYIRKYKPCLCNSGLLFKDCCRHKIQPVVDADLELGQQRIREYEEEQKKQDWSRPLESLPVIDSDLPLFEPLAMKGRIQI